MGFHAGTQKIVTDGLSFLVDAGDNASYGGSGSTWTDVIGGNNGTISGATYTSENNGCFTFDGTNDGVQFSSALAEFFHQKSFSVGLWVKFDQASHSDRETLFHISAGGTRGAIGLRRQQNDHGNSEAGKLQMNFGADDIDNQGAVFTSTDWFYIVATFNSSNNLQSLYTNATLYQSRTAGGNISVSGAAAYIGKDTNGDADRHHDGKIANCHIYANKVLSTDEITENYNALKTRFGL